MRISDWSSDVCSSDLRAQNAATPRRSSVPFPPPGRQPARRAIGVCASQKCSARNRLSLSRQRLFHRLACFQPSRLGGFQLPLDFAPFLHQRGRRLALIGLSGAGGIEPRPADLASPPCQGPEAHMPELQSLMRKSLALFSLKKK